MKLYGKNPVIERLKSNPTSIKNIYLREHHEDGIYICKKARQHGIPVFSVPMSKIQKIGRNLNTQGVLAEIEEFPYLPFPEALEAALKHKRILLFLDGLTDPQNLGSIIRSVACLGNFSIILPTHDSTSVTESVLRVACGGENYVPVSMVANLNQAIRTAKENDFWIMGTVPQGGEDIRMVQWHFPLGVVIGSEQKGMRDVIKKIVDKEVTIPMAQSRMSLNVAQATALVCYEIMRQKGRPS
jgi:23S rRNA (guanosine2251-2'-O)-methyltransferase